MTPEQIKKHEPMNINNLYEVVILDKIGVDENNTPIRTVGASLRPVTRESIEAFLREFGEKVWDISEAYNSNIDEDIPDKQTAITELITQILYK